MTIQILRFIDFTLLCDFLYYTTVVRSLPTKRGAADPIGPLHPMFLSVIARSIPPSAPPLRPFGTA
jgi:hypothetical protein